VDDSDSNCICDYGGAWLMVSREEEMRKLKERYAQTRGGVVEVEKKEAPKRIATPVKTNLRLPRFNISPYLNIMEGDVRRLFGLKSREQIKKENTYDPLMAAWKRGRNL
jgi:hypothetical protein